MSEDKNAIPLNESRQTREVRVALGFLGKRQSDLLNKQKSPGGLTQVEALELGQLGKEIQSLRKELRESKIRPGLGEQ